MVDYFNTTGIIYQVVMGFSTDVTGSIGLTLFFLLMAILVIGLIFHWPIELLAVICTPLLVVITSMNSSFLPVLIVVLLIDVVILYKNFFP